MGALPTMSAHPRTMRCPASHALPHEPYSTSEAAERGTALHQYLQGGALEDVPEQWRAEASQIRGGQAPSGATEVAFAYDPWTCQARELGRDMGRRYGQTDSEFAGAADWHHVEFENGSSVVHVQDLKTGRSYVPPDSPQLLSLALAACVVYGARRAVLTILTLRDDGSIHPTTMHADSMVLRAHAVALRHMADKIRAVQDALAWQREIPHDTITEGPWCHYCPARAACPLKRAILQRVQVAPMSLRDEMLSLLTPENVAGVYARTRDVVAIGAEMMAALRAYSDDHGPFEVAPGVWYGPRTSQREVISTSAAWDALEPYGQEALRALATETTSKAALERAAKTFAAHGKVAAAVREVLAAIGDAGGITAKQSTRYEERKAK